LLGEYFAGDDFSGKPVATRVDKQIDFDWNSASPLAGVPADRFAVRWTGAIAAPEPGAYDFTMRLAHCYPCADHEQFAVYLDGKAVIDFGSPDGAAYRSSDTPRFTLQFDDTMPHALRVEYRHNAKLFGAGITMEWAPKPGLLEKDAVAIARQADVVVAFVGLSPELEGEEMPIHIEGFSGGDRTGIQLPAPQQHLLEAVAATGKPLVVILMNGSALAVNWAQQHANAILEAWYPGESGGRAIAETLSGKNNPAGRLPITFYKSADQLPAFTDYSMAARTYRYFKGEPLYGFGFGLSYTTFAYSNLHLSANSLKAGETLTVEADVKNTGSRAGDEVAEVYLMPPRTDVSPKLALAGFTRVHLDAGETKHLRFQLDPRALSQVDDRGMRAVNAGAYRISVGGSQPAVDAGTTPGGAAAETLSASFTIQGTLGLPH
jgi:beta-glucosidase